MVFGKGISDLNSELPSYGQWYSIMRRSYSAVWHKQKPTYIGVQVGSKWWTHSNFDAWYQENNIEGWELDKDLLAPELRMYSEDTCVYLPGIINTALTEKKDVNGLPFGVSYKTANKKYVAQLSVHTPQGRTTKHLLIDADPMKCFEVYAAAKRKYVQGLAEEYKSKLHPKAYNKLVNFEVKLK